MASLFCDAPDYYGTSELPLNYAFVSGAPATVTASNPRMAGRNSILFQVGRAIPATQTIVAGVAIRFNQQSDIIMQFMDAGTEQVSVRTNSNGQITFCRGGGVIATTGAQLNFLGQWMYVELKCKIDPSTGTYEVRVNGATVLTATNVNTRNTGASTADSVRVGGTSNNPAVTDIYINDTTGAANNDFLGDIRVRALLPTTDGATTAWTTSTGTNHAALVDEVPPNGDTDFNESSTPGQIDLYNFASTPLVGTVKAVHLRMYARKTDAGTRTIRATCRRSGSNFSGATQALSTSYLYLSEIFELDPSTSAAWTVANLNVAQFGPELVA